MNSSVQSRLTDKKICIVASSGISLTNFRGPLIKTWVEQGNDVTCISIEPDSEMHQSIAELGAKYYQVAGDRTSISISGGLKMIRGYKKAFDKLKPDICYLYMSKPVSFGGLAAIAAKVPHINILVNGLENAYYRTGLKDFVVRCVTSPLYWFNCRKADNVFFQNDHDLQYFKDHHLLPKKNGCIVNGSGVDMERFPKAPLPTKPAMVMMARLLWSKGIREYLAAAKIVKEKYPDFRIMLVGGLDQNDEAITREDLDKYIENSCIEYCGFAEDVRELMKESSIFVLPSYHEGLPRSVLEAMSMGRAIITTDAPGCSDTVEEGVNGFLVPVGDSEIMAQRIMYMIENPEKLAEMAENSYRICKEKFEVNKVNKSINQKIEEKL